MRVAIDATALGSHRGGDETLVRSLLRGLAGAVHESDAVEVLTSAGAQLPAECRAMPGAGLRVTAIERRSGPRHFALDLPAWLRRLTHEGRRPDLVVALTHAPVWSPAPVALLVTDLSFIHDPGGYPAADRWRLRLLVGAQVRRAAQVLTISDFCRTDLEQTYQLAAGSVQVLPLVVDAPTPAHPAARAALAGRGVPARYLLYLGNLHPRKNVPRAIEAFLDLRRREPELSGYAFVVAGRAWFGGTAEREAARDAPPGAVIFLDRVDDAEREVLLRDAEALVYPSIFEGFGLPPLEAMARGTPVLASAVTAIPEVCRDAALLVDPHDTDALAEGMRRVLLDAPLRDRLRTAGFARAAAYDVAGVTQAWRRVLAPSRATTLR